MPSDDREQRRAERRRSAFISRITQPAISAAIEPTDRSMPPEMMTKHMPTAMMPMKAVRVSTFIALSSGGEIAVEQRAGDAQQHQADDRAEAVQARPRSPDAPAGRACGRGGPAPAGVRVRCRWHGRSAPLRSGVRRRAWPAAGPRASRDAVAQADQLHQLGRDDDHGHAPRGRACWIRK